MLEHRYLSFKFSETAELLGGEGILRKSLAIVASFFSIVFALGLCVTLPVDGQCVNIPPVADFTFSPSFPYTNETIVFDGSASHDPNGFIFSYTWDFGDGNVTVVSSLVGPLIAHFYTNLGEYNVSLLVKDNLGATNSTSKTIFVRSHVTASFSYTPPAPHVHELMTFDASNSTVTNATIVSYAWDFGDGNRSAVGTPLITHSYVEAKAYNVTLNVTSSNGDWDVESEIVNVTELPKVAPKAAFRWLPPVPEAGQPVEFNASESAPDGGEITSYAWDFGDETTQVGSEPIMVHVYQNFGSYIVLLNVTDSDGFSDVVNHSITVMEKPLADFLLSPKEPRVYNVVVFNASISDPRGGEIVSFEWNFGDGSAVQFGVAVTHRFRKMGEYVVSLNVTDSENLWGVKNVTVKILPHIADLNEDGVVNILDIVIFARAYGTLPGQERWNQRADLDGNKIINILDGVVVARSYNMCIEPFDP